MSERIFINMPTFAKALQRLGKRRYEQEVIVCRWKLSELRTLSEIELCSFVDKPAASSVSTDVYWSPTGLVRRCRKKDGASFGLSDLEPLSTMSLADCAASILSEADHPYLPMLSLQDRLSLEHPVEPCDWGPDPAAEWRRHFLVVDNQIFVPTLAPTLSVSLDRGCDSLIVAVSCPPATPLALRLPTVHLPYGSNAQVLQALAADLGVGLAFPLPPTSNPRSEPLSDQWITKTLADLHLYMSHKGVRLWPDDLPFEMLERTHQGALYAYPAASPLEWFGQFLDTPSKQFAHLAGYIEGLQMLIHARYRVLGGKPPPMSADGLAGISL